MTKNSTAKSYAGTLSYQPQLVFLAGSKACFERSRNEILQAWFRTGSVYTSNGVVEFVKQLLTHVPNRIRIIVLADSGINTLK